MKENKITYFYTGNNGYREALIIERKVNSEFSDRYVHKEDAIKIVGYDSTKVSDCGLFMQLMYDAIDDTCIYYKQHENEKIFKIGFNTEDYERKLKLKSLNTNSINDYRGYEYINKKLLKLILIKANTEEGRKYRIEAVSR